MLTVQFEKRDATKKADGFRRKGKIPAVFYGKKEASTPITVGETEFKKVWSQAGESSVVVLKNGAEEHEALIHDVELHPVSGKPLHADFYVFEKGKKLKVAVPIEFIGLAPAIKDFGGTLIKVLHNLEIEAMPKDLPQNVKIDTSKLVALDSKAFSKDIVLPAGVTLITGADEVVAAIAAAREEPVEEAPAASLEDIELVGQKGKEPGAEGEAAAGAATEGAPGKEGKDAKKDSKAAPAADAGAKAKK